MMISTPTLRRLCHTLIALSFLLTACRPQGQKRQNPSGTSPVLSSSPVPVDLVSAHTIGTISKTSPIRIVFTKNLAGTTPLHLKLHKEVFELTPEVDGYASWHALNELVFTPRAPLQSGVDYQVKLQTARVSSSHQDPISFSFSVITQAFELSLEGLEQASSTDTTGQTLQGIITTADSADPKKVEAMLTARSESLKPIPTWDHSENGQRHHFTLTDIRRQEQDASLEIQVSGEPIGVDQSESHTVEVPGLSNFSVQRVEALSIPEKLIKIRFSDPLKKGQNLQGLISVGNKSLRFQVEGNVLSVYSVAPWSPNETISISRGIQNARGRRLPEGLERTLTFIQETPGVRFAHKGNIIPTQKEIMLPIEVVNLRAVWAKVIQINPGQIPQFLQVNAIDGNKELRRVGKTVWEGRVKLPQTNHANNSWRRVGLDLSGLSAKTPNGIYRLRLSFTPRDITYQCANGAFQGNSSEATESSEEEGEYEDEESYWDQWDESGSRDNYRNRMNPCHRGYYTSFSDHTIVIERNLFISSIGVMAKQGSDGVVTVVATDLNTAKPLSNASVELIDYQQESINKGITNNQGVVPLVATRKPFLVAVEANGQKTFLKLSDGASLSVSNFDVSGVKTSEGLKGFLYGERGIWRPGDKIYLGFILLDVDKRLPKNHPVRFELRNPRGQLVERQVSTTSLNGVYTFQPRTDPEAITGNYTAKVHVGNAVFERIIKVETIIPNRLKVDLKFPEPMIMGLSPHIEGKLSSTWLHGAIAKNLKTDVKVSLFPTKTRFSRYQDYDFDDLSRRVTLSGEPIFEGTLDDKGEVPITHTLELKQKPAGMLKAHFETRVFEPSGAFSTDHHSIKLSPYERYIGIKPPKGDRARGMLLTNTEHTLGLVALTSEGEDAANTQVDVALHKISWRWWWQTGDGQLADYTGNASRTPVQSGVVDIKEGKGEWKFQIDYPAWGRYVLVATDRNGGHRTAKIVYIDWPGWAGKGQKENPGGAHILSLSTDKREYKVGEIVSLSIPTSATGRILVSLESGSKVLKTAWVTPRKKRTQYTFTVTREMAPNIYAYVTLLQPHRSVQNDLPIRLYGITPIRVVAPRTRLNPLLKRADTFEPNTDATVEVSEGDGKAMTYTLAIVDEGLLGLTRYKTPNPWSHFYRRESLGVKTWDIFDWVAGAYGGKLENFVAIGGSDDEEEEEGESASRKRAERFPPFVHFDGPFTLEPGKTSTHTVPIPQYLGAGRIMVVAASGDAFGAASKTVTIKKPLMVLATLPRVLGPEEEVNLPVSVFALEPGLEKVSVSVSTEGPLELVGVAQRELVFTEPGEQWTAFKLKVTPATGVGKVHITAQSGEKTNKHSIELMVRHPLLPTTETFTQVLESGESWSTTVDYNGLPGTHTAGVEISKTPPLNLGERLNSLIAYPHGCAEQTTSRAFPQVYLSRLLELSPKQDQAVRSHVNAAIKKLQRYQLSSGGFGYWEGQQQVNDWSTSYIGHFLVEAQNAGFPVPSEMLTRWTNYQREVAGAWTPASRYQRSNLMQAYRLYTLALRGKPALSAMNRFKENATLSTTTQWRLAAAYHLAGQPRIAAALTKEISPEVQNYHELSGTFGSTLRDRAMILETLVLLGRTKEALITARLVSEELSSAQWLNTQATAFSLVALARFGINQKSGSLIDVSYTLNKGTHQKLLSSKPVTNVQFSPENEESDKLKLVNDGISPVFVSVHVTGLPILGEERSSENLLHMTVNYFDNNQHPIDVSSIEQGTDFIAEVVVTNQSTRALSELALSHLFPSGWEIHNERLSGATQQSSGFDYQDIRDDRVYTYFSLPKGQSRTFKTTVNASYAGKFYLPMVGVEAMYDASLHSYREGRWVEVFAPKPTN